MIACEEKRFNTFYATRNKTNTYAILWRLQTANRLTRIEPLIATLEEGKKLY